MGAGERASGVMSMHETGEQQKAHKTSKIEPRCLRTYEELSHIHAGEEHILLLFAAPEA